MRLRLSDHGDGGYELLHSFPTRRSSDLGAGAVDRDVERAPSPDRDLVREVEPARHHASLVASGLNFPNQIAVGRGGTLRSEEHTSELQSRFDLVCRLLLEKKR